MMKITKLAAALSIAVLSQHGIAKGGINVDNLLKKSDLVMQGEVIDIQYKDSKEGLPHTFVTYQVNEMISGSSKSDTVTLRFIGGEQRQGEKTRYLTVSEVPTFEKGESDILFVTKNNSAICPLVSCSQGRFRNLNGLVTSEDGQPLLQGNDKSYKLGSSSMVEEIKSVNRKEGFSRAISSSQGEAVPQTKQQRDSAILDTATFVANLKERAYQLKTKGLQRSVIFKSSNVNESFSTPIFKAVTPPQENQSTSLNKTGLNSTKSKQPGLNSLTSKLPAHNRAKSEFDLWEEKALKENGGEPVVQVPAKFKQD
ncbi:MAG: hypothetical protein OQK04_02070 [Kangiellaceae bacterium]|nr:hypothetical protein [Kangiellaceae bacterium]MCW8997488.1 hypothetical protein [Kangiellaceae bacterium]